MKRFLAMLSLGILAMPLSAARVEIVLDVSGSMNARAGTMTRIQAAQAAVRATVSAIDPSSNVALRLYGHRLPPEPKAASCRDTELVIPFGKLDQQRFVQAVNSAKPLGQTPLAFALEQAAADFGQIGNEPVAVILISDGEESCGGDPAKVACEFRQRGLELTIHTVGFDVGNVARQQLQAVANCTGGQYRDVKDVAQLSESLRQLTQAGLLLDKQREVNKAGNVVRGGNGFGSAVPIAPGVYRLDHIQRPSDYDYFVIDVPPGHILRVSQDTAAVGVEIQGNKMTESSYPTAGVVLYAPDQTMIGEDSKVGRGQRASVGTSIYSGHGGKFYIAIGQRAWSGWGITTESPFTIEVADATDAGSGTDAGDTAESAVKIQPGAYKGWAQNGDPKDTYVFDATAGATYDIKARAASQNRGMQLTVADEDGVELGNASSPNTGAAVKLEGIKPTRSGRLYLTVTSYGGDDSPYTLDLTGGNGATTATPGAAPVSTSTSTSTANPDSPQEKARSLAHLVPGGCATCLVVVIVLILVFVGLIVLIVKMIRKKKS